MIAFNNIKTGVIRIFDDISETPTLYAETIALTEQNKELKQEEIEWELIPDYQPPQDEF